MKKLNNKGYMLVEIIVASAIALVMAYFLIDVTIKLVNKNNDYYIDSLLVADKSIVTKEIMNDINSKKLVNVVVNNNTITLTYVINNTTSTKELSIDEDTSTITYGEYKKKLTSGTLGKIEISNDNNILVISIPIYTNYSKEDYGIKITVPYSEDIGIVYPVVDKDERIDDSGANYPELAENMIPVMYDTLTSKWVVADTTSSTTKYGWYDYDQKKWANAVLVTETKRNSLTTDAKDNYTPGQVIGDSESDGVLAFYVWIPRYKYKVWNIDRQIGFTSYPALNEGIDIKFIDIESEDEGEITCSYSTSETCNGSNGQYYTHPAFTFGDGDITGFWMGKFELTYFNESVVSGDSMLYLKKPLIIPNSSSWTYETYASLNSAITSMQSENNIYGLSHSPNALNSHMISNLEWGAVAYLANSKYGRCTGGESSTCTEVSRNNSGRYAVANSTYTGRSCGMANASGYSNTGSYQYDYSYGTMASTTGNIYGIYDMSGGSEEYVTFNGLRLGDGTTEVRLSYNTYGLWYGDPFVYDGISTRCICRGHEFFNGNGTSSSFTASGIFAFWETTCDNITARGTRAALTVFPKVEQ